MTPQPSLCRGTARRARSAASPYTKPHTVSDAGSTDLVVAGL